MLFRAAWRGEARLWQAYWLIGVLGGFLMSRIAMRALDYKLEVGYAVLAIGLAYQIFALICIFRCAPNTSKHIWSVLARIFAIIGLGLMLLNIYQMVAARQVVTPVEAVAEQNAKQVEEIERAIENVDLPKMPSAETVCDGAYATQMRQQKRDPAAYPDHKARYMATCVAQMKESGYGSQ